MNRFTFVDCKTVPEALDQMGWDTAVKAGGIDLLDLMKEGISTPSKVVNIRNVTALRGITANGEELKIGPLATLEELSTHGTIRAQYAALADAAGHAATPQVRNMATLGGNLMQRPRCWYFRSEDFDCRKKGGSSACHAHEGENQYHAIINNSTCAMVHPSSTAVPLLAFGARVELASKTGQRVVALKDFYNPPEKDLANETVVRPDELITAVLVPIPPAGTKSAYQKYAEKESFDWPLADAGVVLQMDGPLCREAAIVLGVAAPTPQHATAAEGALRGKELNEAVAREAGRLAVANATPLSNNGYKKALFETAVYRTVLLAAGLMGRDRSAVGGVA